MELVVGKWFADSDELYFDGIIDQARIYNSALTATEIQQLFDAGQ